MEMQVGPVKRILVADQGWKFEHEASALEKVAFVIGHGWQLRGDTLVNSSDELDMLSCYWVAHATLGQIKSFLNY